MALTAAADAAARTLLGWAGRWVDDSRRPWIDALGAELDVIDGGWARLAWSLGGLRIALMQRRRDMRPRWLTWPSVLADCSFGLGLGLLLIVGIVWTNVIVPSHESDSEYQGLYLLFAIGLLVYFAAAGFVAGRRHRTVVAGLVVGALTAVLVAIVIDVTFAVVDNVFLDIVSQQPDKISGFQQSGMHSMRDYVNSGLVAGTLFIVPFFGLPGAAAGTLGGAIARLLPGATPRSAPADGRG